MESNGKLGESLQKKLFGLINKLSGAYSLKGNKITTFILPFQDQKSTEPRTLHSSRTIARTEEILKRTARENYQIVVEGPH